MIGYDLDGVICKENMIIPYLFKVNPTLAIKYRYEQPVLYMPIENSVIITGRLKRIGILQNYG